MDVQPRPPLYLTDTDFDRLRLTDEQWSKMEIRLIERTADKRAKDQAQRERDAERERILRPPFVVFISFFLAAACYFLIELITDQSLYGLIGQPFFIILWTAVVAWMMRKG